MASQSQKPVRVGLIEQPKQQPEQPGRTPSPEKSSSSRLFAGWNEGSLSLPSGSGLRPPHPPSPQPSPKTQLSSINPFESRRPLRLGEHSQGTLRLPNAAPADGGFIALPKNYDLDEYALTRTPTIELHPAQHKLSSTNAVPTPTSSSSDKWSSSETSSYAHVLQRERLTKRNFKKVMVAPPHLSLPISTRPAPPRNVVSSPAIVMQSAPPSPGFPPPLKSMTFSDALSKSRNVSSQRQEATRPHISFHNSNKTRRVKASVPSANAVSVSIQEVTASSPSRGHHRSLAYANARPRVTTQSKSSDCIPRRDARSRPGYPENLNSFVSTVASTAGSLNREAEETSASPPPEEEVPKQGFLRVLTVHSIVPAPTKRETAKLLNSKSPYRRQSKQSSIMSRSYPPGMRCFGLLHRACRRRRNTHASIQNASTSKGVIFKRKDSYVGADGREYIHRPVPGLSFLPSEMQRVNTPPVGRGTQNSNSRSRGFFFDYTNPPGTGEEAETRRDSVAGSTEPGRKPSSP
ncbi:hypothetical protein QM012_008447 [Aureobasidium pullulans]|uniref:Uncharacterized protein n=1 Tax=Aureobasidium pullulans TaxID=5580 RepID=A0ABR0TKY8_AURPU